LDHRPAIKGAFMRLRVPWSILFGIGLLLSAGACSLPFSGRPTATSTPEPSATVQPPTPTFTPAPTPTPAPTLQPAARVEAGDRALFNGDYAAALQAYSAALSASSDPEIQAAGLVGQGRVYWLTGRYPEALDALRAAASSYPNTAHAPAANFYLGEVYTALDRFGEAAEAYAAYRMLRPGLLDAFISERRGDALTSARDHAGALTEYTQALQAPRLLLDFSLEFKLAQAYTDVGDTTTALVVYDDIYNRTGSDYERAQADYLKGQILTAQGQPEAAQAAYLDAVNNYPRAYHAYLALVALVETGYPVDELQRGLVDYYAGEYGVALAAFDRYLDGAPAEAAAALYYQGMILRDQDDLEGALAVWETVILNHANHYLWDEAWEQKAYTLWAYQGDYAAGLQTLVDFVAAAPAHPRAAEFLFDAGRVAERAGQLAEAARLLTRLPVEYPATEYGYRSLFLAGICHYRLGDYTSAQEAFWQAQSLAMTSGERAGAYFWMGKNLAAQGDMAGAQTTWEQATAFDPTGYYSERARDLLLGRAPFTQPVMFDVGSDHAAEQLEAETWLRAVFALPTETDLSVPGGLVADSRFTRGTEFWQLGLAERAAAEFNSLREASLADPVNSYRLAVYLSELGLYRPATIAARQVLDLAGQNDATTLTAPALFTHIRFGTYYPELIIPLAQTYAFHPLFVWSLVRQESLFEGFVESAAGARGLMQIMPATGADIAYRTGWPPDYTDADLYRPVISLTLGLDYLADQRAYFAGDIFAALAAYNGGPGNAANWLALSNGDPDLFVEVIRFDETRNYVMGIYEVFSIYRRVYERVP
jgi:soluble lytic murein transglycosylase